MPAKVYLDSPPGRFPGDAGTRRRAGDRQMGDLVSAPIPGRGLPVVVGVIVVSDAETGESLAVIDGPLGHLASHRGGCRPVGVSPWRPRRAHRWG